MLQKIGGKKMIKRLVTICTLLMFAAGLLLTGCSGQEAAPENEEVTQKPGQEEPKQEEPEKLKVALVLSGPINDNGWNSVAYEGLRSAESEFGIEGAYMESVAQSDQEEAYRNYANQGFHVIIGHGFQFNDTALKVASDFPDIKFVVTSSSVSQAPNVAALEVSNKEAGFIGGMIASALTTNNKVAFIGGVDMPPITDAEAGFIVAAKMVNPDVEIKHTLTGSFDDVNQAKETAIAFIQEGCDIVLGNANQAGLGVIEAAQENGAYAIGFSNDQSQVAPETVVASSKYDYSVGIKHIIKEINDGKFEPKHYLLATAEGATGVIWNEELKAKLDQEAVQLIEQYEQDLISKKIDTSKVVE
jgi:basic membrane protein A